MGFPKRLTGVKKKEKKKFLIFSIFIVYILFKSLNERMTKHSAYGQVHTKESTL